MPTQQPRSVEPSFVSQQVSKATRYYLNLNPSRRAGLVVVCGGVERVQREYRVQRTDFPFYAVELVAEGAGTLMLAGRKYALSPGVAFAYGPGVPHTIRNDPRRPMLKYYVDFAGKEAARLLKQSPLGAWRARRLASHHELADLFDALGREAREAGSLADSICEHLLRVLLLKVQQKSMKAQRNLPRAFVTYDRIRRHIEQHAPRLQGVTEIARECHVTPMHISRLFRRFGPTGAYQFLQRHKMNVAAEMILEQGLLVKEAAHRLGFRDAFVFSRTFKRVHGVPPSRLAVLETRRAQE